MLHVPMVEHVMLYEERQQSGHAVFFASGELVFVVGI